MKLSTKILLTLLVAFLIGAAVSVVMVGKMIPTIAFNGSEHKCTMVIESNNPDSLPECKVRLVTTPNKCDSLVVNFDNVHPQVSAMLRNDSIVVVIDSALMVVGDEEILCVELPRNVGVELHNPCKHVNVELEHCDIAFMLFNSPSDLNVRDTNLGTLLSAESSTPRVVSFDNTNIGTFKLYGNATNLNVNHSNVGTAVIGGICDAIAIHNSNIGACSWSSANSKKAQCVNSVINASVDEGLINITYDNGVVY